MVSARLLVPLAAVVSTVLATSAEYISFDDSNCNGNIQDQITWDDTQGVHNIVLEGAARNGAVSIRVNCNDEPADCATAFYGKQYGEDLIEVNFGSGCYTKSQFIDSVGFFVPGAPYANEKREAAPTPTTTEKSPSRTLRVKRETNTSDPRQRGTFFWDQTLSIEWDPAPGTCSATYDETADAMNVLVQEYSFDGGLGSRGTLTHEADIYDNVARIGGIDGCEVDRIVVRIHDARTDDRRCVVRSRGRSSGTFKAVCGGSIAYKVENRGTRRACRRKRCRVGDQCDFARGCR